tara:strand:+ start:269 stop:574 length:306 start_codon:yes stop_codon:yes gene_type:complete
MNIRDIIPHVSVSDFILKNKEKHHGKHGINPVSEQKIKTFWIEIDCDMCEDGKIYSNMVATVGRYCPECDGTGRYGWTETMFENMQEVRKQYPNAEITEIK